MAGSYNGGVPAPSSSTTTISRLSGRVMPVAGHDIDTDRIMPARFLKAISFEGLEGHVFEDDRAAATKAGAVHAFDDPRFAGASILVVNRNFGCGSSREHAPQSLLRRGIKALVGESFAEIFFGNCVALGMPCLTASPEDVEELLRIAEKDPRGGATIDIASGTVAAGGRELKAHLPAGVREAFCHGTWDATGLLLDRFSEVEAVAGKLPYLRGF